MCTLRLTYKRRICARVTNYCSVRTSFRIYNSPILARNAKCPYISSPPDPSKTNLKALCRNKMEIYYVTSFSTLVNFDGLNVSVEPKQRLKERQKTNLY